MPVTVRVECDVEGCGRHFIVAQHELEYIEGLGGSVFVDGGDPVQLGEGWRATGTQWSQGSARPSDFMVVCADHAEESPL